MTSRVTMLFGSFALGYVRIMQTLFAKFATEKST